jgi:TetR/AcrR family transcriptional regulator
MEDSKVEIILDAARKRFAHYGLSKTTMTEIGNDIGMSKAALYYYFADKERLFIAVLKKDIAEFESAVQDLLAKPTRASFKLKKYVAVRSELFHKLLNLAKLENANLGELVNPLYNDLKSTLLEREKAMVRAILESGIKTREFVRFPLDEYVEVFVVGMVGLRTSGFTFNLISGKDAEFQLNQKAVLFTEIFLKAIRRSGD